MNRSDIAQIVKDNFKAFYKTNASSIETNRYKYGAIRAYAAGLWQKRIDPEIERDQLAAVTVFDYMLWCREQWQELRPLKPGEHPRPDPDREAFNKVREFVKVMAAVKFSEYPDQFSGPDVNYSLEEWAKHFWGLRSADQKRRDKKLGIVLDDYVLWVFEEFQRKPKVKTC